MSIVTPEMSMKIAAWRQKVAEGTLTLDDMKEAIVYLRAGRVNAQNASAASKRKKAIVAIPSAADMLSDLENM
jgi:hypothetical protein